LASPIKRSRRASRARQQSCEPRKKQISVAASSSVPSPPSSSDPSMASASASWTKRWLRPEVYPLFVATGVAVGICGMQLIRNITGNPEVRVLKEKRAAGVLENFDEGKRYSQHGFRKFIDGRKPEIMQSLNSWMADPPKDD
ncbi:unnamed protein product, partial [Urochloa humidicola]